MAAKLTVIKGGKPGPLKKRKEDAPDKPSAEKAAIRELEEWAMSVLGSGKAGDQYTKAVKDVAGHVYGIIDKHRKTG